MKTLVLAVAIAALSAAQSGNATLAGVWTARFEGATFVRLELKVATGTVTGGLSLGNVEFNDQGAVRHAVEASRELTPINDVVQRGSIVTFSRKEGRSTDRFEFRQLDASRAELILLLSDEDRKELAAMGIPALKPFALTK